MNNSPVIHSATFEFLKAINEHNSRKYFASIRPLYDQVLEDITIFCQQLINTLAEHDSSLQWLQAKDCLFRIYRDARRIKEWDPLYKNNFGFHIGKDGKKWTDAGYYVQFQEGNCLLAGGIYRPTPEQLLKLRQKISLHGDEYLKITQKKEFVWRFGEIQWTITTKIPRGFPKDINYPDLVKRKQHLIYHRYEDAEVVREDFFEKITKDCNIAKQRFDRLNDIL